MRFALKPLLTAIALVVGAAVLVPIAAASTSGTTGGPAPAPLPSMMPTPSPSSSGTMMPTPTPSPSATTPTGSGWSGGGMWNGSGAWGGTGMWGTGTSARWLTSHPAALQAWLQLRAADAKAMQTWYDTYKTNLTSAAAQQALHATWTTFWNNMKAFYQQYGNGAVWTCPSFDMWGDWMMGGGMMGGSWNANHMWGAGYGASWMTSHVAGMGQWLTLRAKQTTALRSWQRRYASNLRGSSAQAALGTLMTHNRVQVKSFYRHHGMTATAARMRYGAGGWMGLGGMWGGFGW